MAARARLGQTRPTGGRTVRGLVSSRRSGRRIEAGVYPTRDDLADIVEVAWAGRWDLRGQAPHTTERVPDPCVNVVFEVGSQPGGRVVGAWTRLWRRTLEGAGHVRGVKLRAGAVRAVIPRAAHTLADRIVPLAAIVEDATELARLERAVLEPADDAAAFGALFDWIAARRVRPLDPEIVAAIAAAAQIAADPTIVSVERLARHAGVTVRALQRLFRKHVGITPKRAIRNCRLQEVAARIERGSAGSLARLAAELGYTDQSHMARDWKAITGRSPRGFADSLGD